jgi:hypothetical protein
MTKYTDNLWRDLVQEHGATFARVDRTKPDRVRRPRTRVIAASTLALAAVGTVLALTLTAPARTAATGGTSTAAGGSQVVTAAYTITRNHNGSVLVELNQNSALPQVNAKLTAMGIDEQVEIQMESGPAQVKGPVTCTPKPGAPGPTVKILDGTDGTEVIAPGTTGDNTGVGTWHLGACWTFKTGDTGSGTGNSGAGPTVASPSAG